MNESEYLPVQCEHCKAEVAMSETVSETVPGYYGDIKIYFCEDCQ